MGSRNSRNKQVVDAGSPFINRGGGFRNYGLNYNYYPRMNYPFLYFPLPPSNFSLSRPSLSYAVMGPRFGRFQALAPPLPTLQAPRPWYQAFFNQNACVPSIRPGTVINLPMRQATAADYIGTQYFNNILRQYPFSNPFIMLLANTPRTLPALMTNPVICFPQQQTLQALPSISLPLQTQQYYAEPGLSSLISSQRPTQLALPSSQPVETIIVKRRKKSKKRKAPKQIVVHEKPIIITERASSGGYHHLPAPAIQPQIQYIPIPYPVPQQQTPQTITTQEIVEEVIPPPQVINEQVPIGYTTSQTLIHPPAQAVLTNSQKFIVLECDDADGKTARYKILDQKDLHQLENLPTINSSDNITLLNDSLLSHLNLLRPSQTQSLTVPLQTTSFTQPYFSQNPTIVQETPSTTFADVQNLNQIPLSNNPNTSQTIYQILPSNSIDRNSFQTLTKENFTPMTTNFVQNASGSEIGKSILDNFQSIQPNYQTTRIPTFANALASAVSNAVNGQANHSNVLSA